MNPCLLPLPQSVGGRVGQVVQSYLNGFLRKQYTSKKVTAENGHTNILNILITHGANVDTMTWVGILHVYIYTRIIKTFSIKTKKDVETSKPKKRANKVGRLT